MKQAFLHFGRNQTKARLKPEKNTKHVVSDQSPDDVGRHY